MLPCLMPNAAAMQGAVLGTARRQRRLKAQRAEADSDAEVEEQGGGAGWGSRAGGRNEKLPVGIITECRRWEAENMAPGA